jgi:hypothetical protein
MRLRGSKTEISSVGFDTSLQGVGADPSGSGYNVGIRVPSTTLDGIQNRYMFMLAKIKVGAFKKVRLTGIRQLVTIGLMVPNGGTNYPLEFEVSSPFWRFTDGNISWHLRRVPEGYQSTANTFNREGLQFMDAQTPALLYSNAPTEAGGYAPPSKVPGVPLIGQFGCFYDLRFGWRNDQAATSLDTEIQGPCEIALYASVDQTDPGSRTTLVIPGSLPGGFNGLGPEDAFVANFPLAQYWRIAGSLIFEEDQMFGEAEGLKETWSDKTAPRNQKER